MKLSEMQAEVDSWIQSHGVRYFNELTNLAILMEEVGELSRHISRKYGEQSYKNSEDPNQLGSEMGDILFVLSCLANQTGINLEEEFKKTLKKNTNRDKDRHKNNTKLT
jgi:NTP pyrophosphatase (non-canonical NTP hydrolase)